MFSFLQINASPFVHKLRKFSWTLITLLFLGFSFISCGDEEEPFERVPGEEETPDGPGDRDETPVSPKTQNLFVDTMRIVDEI